MKPSHRSFQLPPHQFLAYPFQVSQGYIQDRIGKVKSLDAVFAPERLHFIHDRRRRSQSQPFSLKLGIDAVGASERTPALGLDANGRDVGIATEIGGRIEKASLRGHVGGHVEIPGWGRHRGCALPSESKDP